MPARHSLLAADEQHLEAFYMKCQRQITKIRSQDPIKNSEVAVRTGLGPVSDLITRRRNSVFGHITRLPEDTPAHLAFRCHINLTLGHLPDQSWKRRPGRPNNRWIDQLCKDNNNTPPADLLRRSTTRGHTGVMLRSSTTTRWRRRRLLTLQYLTSFNLLIFPSYSFIGRVFKAALLQIVGASLSIGWLPFQSLN